jgi:hypothetical protein
MRKATGNVHTAVSPEFVLEVDDVLYFTGFIDTFGEFCEEHGLEGELPRIQLYGFIALHTCVLMNFNSFLPSLSSGNQ